MKVVTAFSLVWRPILTGYQKPLIPQREKEEICEETIESGTGLNENCTSAPLREETKKGENVKREILEGRNLCIGFRWRFQNVKYTVRKCKPHYSFLTSHIARL